MKPFLDQFGHPEGTLGWLVGHLMAAKNGERSRWLLRLLAPQPGERILEVGFGPGVDIERLSAAVGEAGFVAGIDVSEVMVRQAARRNRAASKAGRVELKPGSAIELPFEDASFDAVYSTNSAQFWPDLGLAMRESLRVLRPGGRVLAGVQPMKRGATDKDAEEWSERLRMALDDAGFVEVSTRARAMRPTKTIGVVGYRPRLMA